ncbi:AAA family ATPase [Peribacillus sp. TH27]|uniref:AAA family ATPase n=1 Tax=Peribacillus sp. TH27 TaxID=2798484 RepID=UPI0019118B4E|nr:AAA family ATPase [Peribacillus sp. TH27]MBK5458952.1 AAA family ATPase [Peribacillus sp. TH27]
MRLKYVYIKNYKIIKEMKIEFDKQNDLISPVSLKFFVGGNGSGKSSFFEAIGLIFTRVLQDETPGFMFDIVYSIKVSGIEKFVRITPNEDKESMYRLSVQVSKDYSNIRDVKKEIGFFSQMSELHPSRIISSASGPTNNLDDIFIHSPFSSLGSDVYDILYPTNYNKKDILSRTEELNNIVVNLNQLLYNPKFLFIDGQTSKLVLIALCAVILSGEKYGKRYRELRELLFSSLTNFTPIAFSLVVDEERLLEDSKNEKDSIALQRFKEIITPEFNKEGLEQTIYDWESIKLQQSEMEIGLKRQKVFVFNIESEGHYSSGNYQAPKLNNIRSPLDFLISLLVAYRDGLLVDAHLIFKNENSNWLHYENSFSDGEYFWLARMGLILLSSDTSQDNILFLFDEPDVHLNESWSAKFVSTMHDLVRIDDDIYLNHEFLVATHSTLILTDALQSQIYLFDKQRGILKGNDFLTSTFGADRDEISKRVNKQNSLNTYSKKFLDEVIKRADIEEIEQVINEVGPGYSRYQLRELLFDLKLNHYK